jgi:hypothetical protein
MTMMPKPTIAEMKRGRAFKRKARKLSVQELRLRLLREVQRLNNAINNVGIAFDQDMKATDQEGEVHEAMSQCAYISNVVDYLFEKLAALEVKG